MRKTKGNLSKISLLPFKNRTSNKACYSIIAIHGLGGQWSSSKTNTWIQGLASHMKWEVRIIRYAYDAKRLTEATYPGEAISSEASKLLQKLTELRSDQKTVRIAMHSNIELQLTKYLSHYQ